MSAPISTSVPGSSTPILDRQAPLPKMESARARAGLALAIWFGLVMVAAIVFISCAACAGGE